jgi:hypothetical protein
MKDFLDELDQELGGKITPESQKNEQVQNQTNNQEVKNTMSTPVQAVKTPDVIKQNTEKKNISGDKPFQRNKNFKNNTSENQKSTNTSENKNPSQNNGVQKKPQHKNQNNRKPQYQKQSFVRN